MCVMTVQICQSLPYLPMIKNQEQLMAELIYDMDDIALKEVKKLLVL